MQLYFNVQLALLVFNEIPKQFCVLQFFQVLSKEDMETLSLCKRMMEKRECHPLVVVFDSRKGVVYIEITTSTECIEWVESTQRILLEESSTATPSSVEKKNKKAVLVTDVSTESSLFENSEEEPYDTNLTRTTEETRRDTSA
ncbi:Histone-lysine N-methyltransferase ATXR6 [Platanthera guangdongensis]|uniref:Histone-lysine N-methyltransferase ATXR6 n=1 Tax=Platanthera guangdongensis TaxID=2320717 RepID=A0ABR2MZU4_9ASPA